MKTMHSILPLLLPTFLLRYPFAAQSYASISGGNEYLNAQGVNGQRTSLQGWFSQPEWNVNPKLGLFADFIGFYTGGENVHGYTGGHRCTFKKSGRLGLFGFTEVGDSRSAKAGVITNAFAYIVGPAASVKLNKYASMVIVLGEYVLTLPHGDVRNNFDAVFGFTFPIGHKQ